MARKATTESIRTQRTKRARHYWNSCEVLALLKAGRITPVDVCVIDYLASLTNGREQVRSCYPSYSAIAKAVGVHRATAIRSAKRLTTAGLVEISPGKRHRSNLYRLVDGRTDATTGSRTRATDTSSTHATPSGATVRPNQEPDNKEPPPSQSGDWSEAEAALLEFGVGRIDDAVGAARGNGLSADDVVAIVEFAKSKPGAYGPGAVYDRIVYGRAGQSPASGWPPESDEYRRRCQTQATTARRAAKASESERAKLLAEAEHAKREQLEGRFGCVLDAMDSSKLNAFASEHLDPFQAERFRRDPKKTATARYTLLQVIEKQSGMPHPVC